MTQAPAVELLDLFVSLEIKDDLLILTDTNPENVEALHKRAVKIHRSLLPLPGSNGKLEKRSAVVRKFIIAEDKKLLMNYRRGHSDWLQ